MSKKQKRKEDEEFIQYIPMKFQTNKKTMVAKRQRMIKHKRCLCRLLYTTDWVPCPVSEIECDNGKQYIKRTYISGGKYCRNHYRWCKKQSNRKVRRCKYVSSRGGYKKVYDLWDEVI